MRGRLNLFQRTMLRWHDLHPYSAVHVVRIERALDAAALRASIAARLEAWGITGLEVDGAGRRYDYRGGPATVVLNVLAGSQGDGDVVGREIERELNTPFPPGRSMQPFRFFAIDEGASFQLGVAYDHFIAGGDSIAVLLTALARGYVTGEPPETGRPELYPATYRGLFARRPGLLARALANFPALVRGSRRCFRPRYTDPEDHTNAFSWFRISPGEYEAVVRTSRAWGVTVNDLFMAMLLRALSPLAEGRRRASRRQELAVASIVNARREFGYEADGVFGQFLAALSVSHRVPDEVSLERLARDVHARTAALKRSRSYLRSLFALGIQAIAWPHLRREQRSGIYSKHFPVWGGVTALHVSAIWRSAEEGAAVADYVRGVSTGPLSPLVLAVTTARDVINVGLTYRPAAFSAAAVEGIAADLRRSVRSLLA